MKEYEKTKEELLEEIKRLRERIAAFERSESEHKRIEEGSKESEQRFRVIFDYANDGMLLTDIKTKKIYTANKTICQMLGYSLDEIKKLEVADIHPTEHLAHTIDRVDKLSRGEIAEARSIPVKRKDSTIFYADITCSIPVILGGRTCVISIFRDITAHKRIDELKDEFVGTVSHELRSPLSIIKEGINLVLDEIPGKINEKQSKILKTAKSNLDRLARIINDLLDISKIEAGEMKIKKEQIDITSLIRQVISSFELAIRDKGLVLKINFSKEGISIYADQDAIAQVINNLFDNAIHFTKEGHVEISVREKDNTIECSVSDTGIGISKENIPKLFGKFQQFARISGPGRRGTGLGLSIVKGIIELHGGKIWVESEFGKGTKVIFVLPKK